MRVLVILAAYNGAKYIKEQIESILKQENVEVNIIVFDDCSKDETVLVVNSFKSDNRVELIINNLPTGSAANNFFAAIKYFTEDFLRQFDYVSFADQDDIWLPEKLMAATDMLKNQKSRLYVSNLILWEELTGKKSIIKKSYEQKKYDFLFEGGSAGCTYVFDSLFAVELKNCLLNIDYNNWGFFSHDWFVYFFARLNNFKVSIDDNAYILYRIHSNNVHGQLNTMSLFAIKERLKLIKEGWYFKNIIGFSKLINDNSEFKKIYALYSKNYFTRFFVILRYNFQLMRSRKKMIQFAILSLLPIKIKK
ncbi:glycosyltransferase [Flavobacterium sp. 2]|uniref:glycosyltransferase n=1 Tax=Flavobacterium sp. 2 TaxID=308053 RepID=UPI000C17FF57|nr:glycosyltransferase [Flavobacterium sp. 2]PIF59339.1 rhamnosyltransferase [Flavobacterium sp. 2]